MGRVIPGLAMAGLWLLLLLKGSFLVFSLVLLLAVILAGQEYIQMVLPGSSRFRSSFIGMLIVLPVLVVVLSHGQHLPLGLLLSFLLLSFYVLYGYRNAEDSFFLFSRAAFGLLYISLLVSYLGLLALLPEGMRWILILTAITAGSDSGAYYSGRMWGRHKLCPLISPKKTVEGAVGGIISGVVAALIMAWLLLPQVKAISLIPIAICLGGIGICGDLAESIIKRATATKDSGRLLGGHGGILDRADSLLFAAPVLYYYLVLMSRS